MKYQRRTSGIANLPIGVSANQEIGDPDPGEKPNPVWQREYWDRYMRNEEHLRKAIKYIHQNPVKAGLVASAEEWQWSSAYSGIANLLIGVCAEQEFGAPGTNQEIGDPDAGESK